MSYPGSYGRVTDWLVAVPIGAIGASGSHSARKKGALLELGEEDGIQPRGINTGQIPAVLLRFEDEILGCW